MIMAHRISLISFAAVTAGLSCAVLLPMSRGQQSEPLNRSGASQSEVAQTPGYTMFTAGISDVGDSEFMVPAVTAPMHEVTLTVPFDGLLDSIEVTEGQWVTKDTILARMDSRVAEAKLLTAKIESERTGPLDRAQATLAQIQYQLEQTRDMRTQDAASENEYQGLQHAYERAEADVTIAKEELEVASARLMTQEAIVDEHFLRAPFDGVVIGLEADPGSSMRQGDPVVHLIAVDSLKAEVHVPLGFYGAFKIGNYYQFQADAPLNQAINGRLEFVDPSISAASRTFRCVFVFDNSKREWPVGFGVAMLADRFGPIESNDQIENEDSLRSANADALQEAEPASMESGHE